MKKQILMLAGATLLAVLISAPITAARAASITVTTTADDLPSDPDNGLCSLREAIEAANTNTAVDSCPAGSDTSVDTITVPAGSYSLTGGELVVVNNTAPTDLLINGAGAGVVSIHGVNSRLLTNNGAALGISGVTLTEGGYVTLGGGVNNSAGELTLTNVSILNNSTSINSGGGIYNGPTAALTLDHSTVQGNAATFGGGIANAGGMTIRNGSVITANSSNAGGGIYNAGVAFINASTVSANVSGGYGGGVDNYGLLSVENGSLIGGAGAGNRAGLDGGGISNASTLVVDASTISANTSSAYGGGIFSVGLSATVQNGSVIGGVGAGNSAVGGGGIYTTGPLTVDAGIISANTATGSGGGGGIAGVGGALTVRNASLIGGVGAGNTSANNGGGIAIDGGTLTVDASTISANVAGSGGGIYNKDSTVTVQNGSVIGGPGAGNVSNYSLSGGGGIYTDGLSGPSTIVDASTVSGNTSSGAGGGLYNAYGITTVRNGSTLGGLISGSSNSASTGGGVFVSGGSFSMTGSRMLKNSSPGPGKGVFNNLFSGSAVTITGSCITGSNASTLYNNQAIQQDVTGNWWGQPTGANTPGADTTSGSSPGSAWNTGSPLAAPPLAGCSDHLTVLGDGTGSGTMTSATPSGEVTCSSTAGVESGDCDAWRPAGSGTAFSIVATPVGPGSHFSAWLGCDSTTTTNVTGDTCNITLSTDTTVTAVIDQISTLVVFGAGKGDGSVSGNTSGIQCSVSAGSTTNQCISFLTIGTSYNLVETPAAGSSFTGWSGCGSVGTTNVPGDTCSGVTTISDTLITAGFDIIPKPDLTISKTNDVSGSVEYPNGWTWQLEVVNHGPGAATFAQGDVILKDELPAGLTASYAGGGSNLMGGSGGMGCSVSGAPAVLTCTAVGGPVIFQQNGSFVTAAFTITPGAPGRYDNPINGGVCRADPDNVAAETNEANNDCADTVTVTPQPVLTAAASGIGSGTMTGGAITCMDTAGALSGTCLAGVATGSVVSVVAAPVSGSIFKGWSGACTLSTTTIANDTCTVTVTADTTITAQFQPPCLLVNCSFESPSGANLKPDGWKLSGLKLPGDGTDTTFFTDGAQSLRITNPKARAKKIYQDVTISGAAGDQIAFTFSWKGQNVAGRAGLFRAMVYVYYVKGGAGKYYVNMPIGASNQDTYTIPIAAAKAYKKLRVEIDFGKAGTAWFDALSLTVN